MATDSQIINYALSLLKTGMLPSSLGPALMAEFGITPERARRLAGEALNRRKPNLTNQTNGNDE